MKFAILVWFLSASCRLCLAGCREKESYPRVSTPLGNIEGFYNTSNGGRRYEAYLGIPYAKPPIGDLRFEIPKSISPWTGVLRAKEFGSPCMQYNFGLPDPTERVQGSEDCLYLNIYTPVADESRRDVNGRRANLTPVIFFIPGGGFLVGAGSQYGPNYLLDRDVTLVTINYRLGPLGFLSTENNMISGNMGLKDQVMALRWVKDNIQFFGGDPSRITLFGQSAGGVSVHYHYLTSLTEGLFQGGISLSGTALNPWGLIKNPLKQAKKLAAAVGCPTGNIQHMAKCLKARPANEIVNAISEFLEYGYIPPIGFAPCVEIGGGEFTFIDRQPIDIIAFGDVQDKPWITGVVSEEGLVPTSSLIANSTAFEQLNDEWETIAPYLLSYVNSIPMIGQSFVARHIRQHYLGNKPINRATFNQLVQMTGDRLYVYASETAARFQARANWSPVHVYYFSYRGAHSYSETLSGTTENFGVAHLDDVAYVFDSFFDPTTTVADRKMQKLLIDLWVSFATNGTLDVAGVEWPRLNKSIKDHYRYLHIAGPEEIGMESNPNFGEIKFWNSLGFQENIL